MVKGKEKDMHTIEDTMRLHVMQFYPFGIEESLECAYLVSYHGCELLWRHFDFTAAEALNVW